jgi:hypothetical protein
MACRFMDHGYGIRDVLEFEPPPLEAIIPNENNPGRVDVTCGLQVPFNARIPWPIRLMSFQLAIGL